jgi:hypothetical protein
MEMIVSEYTSPRQSICLKKSCALPQQQRQAPEEAAWYRISFESGKMGSTPPRQRPDGTNDLNESPVLDSVFRVSYKSAKTMLIFNAKLDLRALSKRPDSP